MNRRVVAFALWIVAALCAGMLAFGSTAASAHPGHHDYAHSMAGAAAKTSMATAKLDWVAQSTSESQPSPGVGRSPAVAISFDGDCPDHCDCGFAHGLGSGCCASACVIAANQTLPRPDGGGRRFPVTPPSPMAGVSPTSLLDPPIVQG